MNNIRKIYVIFLCSQINKYIQLKPILLCVLLDFKNFYENTTLSK